MTGTTLITGADGYIGRRVAAALLREGDDRLLLALRATGASEFADKRARLERALERVPSCVPDPGRGHGRVSFVAADLSRDGALDQVDPRAVTRIVHAAAVTRFNVERDLARRVNVEGTVRLTAFAARCAGLRRLTLLSTLYSAGTRSGEIAERRHDEAGFANHYEWSKWAAEETVLAATDLPVSVLRLPTVIADGDDGQVTQYNAFHNTLKLCFYGLLSLLPGLPTTPLSLATAAFTTAAVTRLIDPATPAGIYHVSPDPADTLTLDELITIAFTVFGRDRQFRRRQVLAPAYCDQESFNDLVAAAARFRGGGLIQESLASVAPFGNQLYLAKTFRNDALRAAWPGYQVPDPTALVEAVCEQLVASRWGRQLAAAA
jgi:nucleoside-diphosphate-sugar epimerase